MKLSIIIPFYNEEENVETVLEEILQTNPDAEVVAVNDGSSDGTLARLKNFESRVKILSLSRNVGQSAALYLGLVRSTGDLCAMMDGDGQNDPADIPFLVTQMEKTDVVCGYRKKRNDSWKRKVASRIANKIRSAILHDGVRDTGCTLKIIRREHIKHLIPFNGLHRFLPALLRTAGLRILECPVNHRSRHAGQSKYTIGGRAMRGIYDLIGVRWFINRRIPWPENSL